VLDAAQGARDCDAARALDARIAVATSPGGLDSVAIIAASTRVDVPFVMALQTVRFVLILLLGPAL